MTLREGIDKVYQLLDEYSSGGTVEKDEDLELKMPGLFDIAQKKMAQIQKIVRWTTIEPEEGVTEYDLPEDMMEFCALWKNGRRMRGGWQLREKKLILRDGDMTERELQYFARPETIDRDTAEDHEFEVSEEAAQCMPFFVAAEVLSSDLVQDANIYMSMYQMMVSGLKTDVAGSYGFRQSFFRGTT